MDLLYAGIDSSSEHTLFDFLTNNRFPRTYLPTNS